MITKSKEGYVATCDHPRHQPEDHQALKAATLPGIVDSARRERWYVSIMRIWTNCPECADRYGVEQPRKARMNAWRGRR